MSSSNDKYVEHIRPRCPRCDSLKYKGYKTRENLRYAKCKDCNHRFTIINV